MFVKFQLISNFDLITRKIDFITRNLDFLSENCNRT